ncbi:MAG TPA: hypothetical protein VLU91_02250 [Nitrososphaerales archaeon]|nr:hypothetical protein [Nitrososphaerales archaeon]
MSEESKEDSESDGFFQNYEPIHDGIGVTHWLPPRQCENYDD